MTKLEARNANQARMTKSENVPAEKKPTVATPDESASGRANESEEVTQESFNAGARRRVFD
jgi:hypothetical protein